ncbi:hypothetical protein ALC56_06407, partial [Trachymyrmex septentrionalis]
FLEDISSVVLERVQDTRERYNYIKVNTREARHRTLAFLEKFQERDSGWALSRIMNLTININKRNAMSMECQFKVLQEIMTKTINILPIQRANDKKEKHVNLLYLQDIYHAYQHHHQIFSIGYLRSLYDNSLSKYRFCRDPDCVSWFVQKLRSLAHCVKILAANVSMKILSSEQWKTLRSEIIARYRDPVYLNCNLNYKKTYFIPIKLLSMTKEKYKSFTNNVKIPLKDNKKVSDLIKDENNGNNIVARSITFDNYTRCLNDETKMMRQQSCIRSTLHQVYTISETKIALSPYDDKRDVIQPNSTKTLSWGHYRIPL